MNESRLKEALLLIQKAREWDPNCAEYRLLEDAAAGLRKTAKKRRRAQRRRQTSANDRALLDRIGGSGSPDTDSPKGGPLLRERVCYVCKSKYREPHGRYHMLCARCGDVSWSQRGAVMDLRGRTALVTGGRVKIGYAVALRMLRAGASVHVTTRFPRDCSKRFDQEPDASEWREHLTVHGLDFRDLKSLVSRLEQWRDVLVLDALVNNAAQTVWHPPEHYNALREGEGSLATTASSAGFGLAVAYDLDMQRRNSWVMQLAEVHPAEMLEVHLVNAVAPFLFCSQLRPCFERSTFADRFIVNVSAVEGSFNRASKSPRHPHTNMAKAALNMMTATSASDYAQSGIHMVAVDPGWMSNEAPPDAREQAQVRGFRPPLDAADCAARVCHPIASGLAGAPLSGVLLKDYELVDW